MDPERDKRMHMPDASRPVGMAELCARVVGNLSDSGKEMPDSLALKPVPRARVRGIRVSRHAAAGRKGYGGDAA